MAMLQPFDHGAELTSNAALQEVIASARFAVVLAGHTHRRMVRRVDGVLFINAGTLHRDHNPCFGVIDFGTSAVEFIGVSADGVAPGVERMPFPE